MATFRDRLISACPMCVFCGGRNAAETVEHMPSRNLFDDRSRPKGLEFASCKPCNESTRRAEAVIGFLSRFFIDNPTKAQIKEFKRLMRGAEQHNPGLLTEMWVDQVGVLHRLGAEAMRLPSWDFTNVGGPICRAALQSFGRKLALALHYEVSGNIVPVGGGVVVHHISNVAAYTDGLPENFLGALGPGQTLRAGRWSVAEQFRYASGADTDFSVSGHLAVFRESFALMMMVATDASEFSKAPPGAMILV